MEAAEPMPEAAVEPMPEAEEDLAMLAVEEDLATLAVEEDLATLEAVEDLATLEAVEDLAMLEAVEDLATLEAVEDLATLEAVEDLAMLEAEELLQAVDTPRPVEPDTLRAVEEEARTPKAAAAATTRVQVTRVTLQELLPRSQHHHLHQHQSLHQHPSRCQPLQHPTERLLPLLEAPTMRLDQKPASPRLRWRAPELAAEPTTTRPKVAQPLLPLVAKSTRAVRDSDRVVSRRPTKAHWTRTATR
ncbi:unnamed protein product [Heligmosomoides polygyrus]|uniref:Uncharacterized protein n=1 Tax=Heligmosomoides polygyrus TaxID=6339 RepID=A0A3P8CJB7_HELPZ|nr:unnamed protein product [Heligmosomoides polygyrus]